MDNKKNNMEKPAEELVGQFYEQLREQFGRKSWQQLYEQLKQLQINILEEEDKE